MTTKILIGDDHQIIRDGLRSLIERADGLEVVAEAADGLDVVRMVREHQPDIALMDIGMPKLNGIEATREVRKRYPNTRVIALSMHSEPPYVGRMLKAGAAGYLLKDCAFEELITAIDVVMKDRVYLSPGITGVVVDDYVRKLERTEEESVLSVLTARERQVLQLVAEGQATKQIAATLSVSSKTIEAHRQHIMDKLEIRSIAELTKFALREGLTSL